MSEQARLIPSVPPIEEPDPNVAEGIAPPKSNSSVDVVSPENSGKLVQDSGKTISEAIGIVASADSNLKIESPDSITTFQGINYASFILTCCLAGFAAIVVFRKALKVSVKRFSIGAKTLSLAYLVIAFNSFFGTYLYSRFLNGDSISVPLTVPILSWILVGPFIAVVLNSLLTRENVPRATKIIFDAFIYLIIFGFVVASQIPSLSAKEPLVFSFFGAFFFIVPIIRFSISLKMSKAYHPELQEMFVQILIRSLLILPILLPTLVFLNVYELTSDELTMLLFNLVTFVFVLMTGLLMIISIDYVTQGIGAEQLVAQKVAAPAATPDHNLDAPKTQPDKSATPAPSNSPETSTAQKIPKPVPKETNKPKSLVTPVTSSPSSGKSSEPTTSFEESSETFDFDVEQHDSTVIKFNVSQPSSDESQLDDSDDTKSKRSSNRSKNLKPKSLKKPKSLQLPKAPASLDESKPTDSKLNVKPPEKPKKRF